MEYGKGISSAPQMQITMYMDPEAAMKLRVLATELDKDETELIHEALDLLFVKYQDRMPIMPAD